ncbi:MAG: hypothetical protein OXL68_01245 [Paracoccaceae bacterium]|nr:hypothetical protein [Paracoccaceae bacterium]
MTPEFFEAELHEDVDFSGIDWTVTEKSYHPSIPRDELVNDVSMHANHAMRAWERLELIMSRREKSADRHDFFRLKMRAQRWRDGSCLLSFLNWLFEQSSDYGWGVGRALCCWVGQLLAMGVILVGFAVICCPDEEPGWSRIPDLLMHGLLLSFANSHSFLGLGSGDGWLSGSRDAIVSSCAEAGVFGPIGLVQAVLGPVLLFLVLLTVRNRFRLG